MLKWKTYMPSIANQKISLKLRESRCFKSWVGGKSVENLQLKGKFAKSILVPLPKNIKRTYSISCIFKIFSN